LMAEPSLKNKPAV